MTDSEPIVKMKNPKKNQKRKQRIHDEFERLSKVQRIEYSENVEEAKAGKEDGNSEQRASHSEELQFGPPWKNLQLILCIQNRQLDIQRKVDLAFNFVQAKVEDGDGTNEDHETIKLPRLLTFVNDWIQSLLISSDKKNWSDRRKSLVEGIEAYMDHRCWVIFKFCLQGSLKLHVSLNMSRNLLQPIHFIAKNALLLLDDSSIYSEEYFMSGERYKLYDTAADCVSLVFSSHGGLSNENLDLWVSTIGTVLELVQNMYSKNLDGSNMGAFALRLLCLVLQPFSKFLRIHPARKSGFHNFVDKLLEPLLHLSSEFHLRVNGSNPIWTGRLLKAVEEVLSHGLFHPVHIDGFLILHGSENYVTSCDDKPQDSKTVIKSYHRHLFDVLNNIITRKKAMAMGSIGSLFHLFVTSVRKFKGATVQFEGTKTTEKTSHLRKLEAGEKYSSNDMHSDIRKSLFIFFVQIMEPLLLKVNAYCQTKMDTRLLLSDLHIILKSIGNLLASFMQEKVYMRTEDTSGEACHNFLKKIYNALMSCPTSLLSLSNFDISNKMEMEIFTSSAHETLAAIGYLLEIEYGVVGEDLENLWLVMFSYLACSQSLKDVLDQCSLSSSVPILGCKIITLYGELRQVKNAILAFCKATRLIIFHEVNTDKSSSKFLTSLSNEVYSESMERLLSSQKFVHAIHKSVQSIPEGQVTGCIRWLTDDISESLRWMKHCSPLVDSEKFYKESIEGTLHVFHLQMELLGRGLSRLYAIVLDSVTITEGNSSLLGAAIKELVALMRPCLSALVGQPLDTIDKFLSSVMGKTLHSVAGEDEDLKKFGRSSPWVLSFFFRLFVSCRSLLRQAISLMPPALSKKISAELGDFTAYSARELMERIDEMDMSYFSWIVKPSASLLSVMQFISDIYLQDGSADCCPLIYIFHSMALQRILDLNGLILLFKYLQNSHYKSRIKALKEEAAGLTNFMMENLSCVYQSPLFISDDITCEDMIAQPPLESYSWGLGLYIVDKKSVPTAIWSNLCKNVDIWGNHASKKQLKKFFSHLLCSSLHTVAGSFQELGMHKIDECKLLKRVTLPQISSELLSNSILYEQRFARRNMASQFCRALEKSVLPLFSNIAYTDVNLQTSPDWLEFFNALDHSAMVSYGNKDITVSCSAIEESMPHPFDKLPADVSREKKSSPLTSKSFTTCHRLLNLLCWMPDINAISFSHYVTCIFNLERLLVTALLHFQGTMCLDFCHEFLGLLVSCRKTLRYTVMKFSEKAEADQSSPNSIIYESSFPVLWLFKSVYVIAGLKEAFLAHNATLVRSMIFSLMDHTSYVLLGMGKYQAVHVLPVDKESEKSCGEMSCFRFSHEDNHLFRSAEYVGSSKFEGLKSLTFVADNLKEQMQSLKDTPCSGNGGFGVTYENMNRLSSTVSCFSGLLWGFASVMDLKDMKGGDHKAKVFLLENEHTTELNICIYTFVEVIEFFVHKIFDEENKPSKGLSDAQYLKKSVHTSSDTSFRRQKSEAISTCLASSATDNGSEGVSAFKKMRPESENSVASVLSRVDSFEPQCLNKPLLQRLLKGDYPEATFLLRQLLIASSALLRLNLQKVGSSLISNFVPTFIEISRVLLMEFSEMVEVPEQSALLLLDGVLSYLRELANYFPLTDPTSSSKVYSMLMELYLKVIGKTISLQGKRATLTFHERQSSTKTLHKGSFATYSSSGLYCLCLDEFKTRLRMSFKAYIEKPSELHLLSAIEIIEKALVGVHGRCSMVYDIQTSADGGKVSSLVAAGIDCYDMIIEFVSGRKGLKLIKRHMQSLVAAVFNIILHLQSPQIFCGDLTSRTIMNDPDSGSTILMCVEVLVTVSRKHALFKMDAWHVGHLLHIPASIFQNILRISQASGPSHSLTISEDFISHPVAMVNFCRVDHQFAVNLFVACCQLLCTTIKHHQSECKKCVAHLEASVSVLLNCLETVDSGSMLDKGCFSWEVEEGVKCACFFRRIYEEIKQQKEIFSRQCSLFLSNYIWVYSGYGPRRSGIRREIDEALRPGVYALIDTCSVDDLQYLHTVFGEGPCRNTLASLQHDYKLNFKYEGKV